LSLIEPNSGDRTFSIRRRAPIWRLFLAATLR